jgi:hypothetical protein
MGKDLRRAVSVWNRNGSDGDLRVGSGGQITQAMRVQRRAASSHAKTSSPIHVPMLFAMNTPGGNVDSVPAPALLRGAVTCQPVARKG